MSSEFYVLFTPTSRPPHPQMWLARSFYDLVSAFTVTISCKSWLCWRWNIRADFTNRCEPFGSLFGFIRKVHGWRHECLTTVVASLLIPVPHQPSSRNILPSPRPFNLLNLFNFSTGQVQYINCAREESRSGFGEGCGGGTVMKISCHSRSDDEWHSSGACGIALPQP